MFAAQFLEFCINKEATMGTIAPDAATFFDSTIHGNLTKITWVHAVNDFKKLNQTLDDESIMMVEADVVLGTVGNSSEIIPIMAHPPDNTSDLSLADFLTAMIKHKKKGIKLDFKTIETFNASLEILTKHRENMTFPVWLNADILSGPVDADTKPVDSKQFLSLANKTLPESTLSVGWTTRYGIQNVIFSGNYSEAQIDEMIKSVSNTSQPITYPVRAGLAAGDITVWSKLLNSTADKNATLTIWSTEGDKVDVDQLIKLIQEVGYDRVYVDVPEKLRKQLAGSATSASISTFVLLSSIFLGNVLLANLF
ncbi:protein FAM151B isoform X3 [Cotesia glomerata]|uniref:protein FAM151B isoform X3 n=1 Tax=Cotesia glomerata TaxID=32391 RepID=UPI001D00F2AB|nr:protein FAM151B isoform X3 [Cotesia glomerata]